MQASKELLPDTWLLRLKQFDDLRGSFVKTYAESAFAELGIKFNLAEEFYSLSRKDVIRGMHFQLPPHDHVKLVYCGIGSVLDVLLDLRVGPGYGRIASVVLSADKPQLIAIPKGIAHGFLSLCDNSLMIYKTSTEYAQTHDSGVRWDSFGFDWQCSAPILSDRDLRHVSFSQLVSPFCS